MGRKGVSKRKPGQLKTKPLGGGAGGSSVSSIMQAPANQPARAGDAGKAAPSKSPADRKKNNGKA